MIIDIEGSGDKAEAIVRFRDVGEKRLLLAWAPLQEALTRRVRSRPVASSTRGVSAVAAGAVDVCSRSHEDA